jgi:hypothetical protein
MSEVQQSAELTPAELDVLAALAGGERWHSAHGLAGKVGMGRSVVLSALGNLRRRALATVKHRGVLADPLYSITTLGEGELERRDQLRLDGGTGHNGSRFAYVAGGGWRAR